MFKFFSTKKTVSQSRIRGLDGIRECDRMTLRNFQAKYEGSHIDAVKAALKAARDPNFIVNEINLEYFINNEVFTEAGYY